MQPRRAKSERGAITAGLRSTLIPAYRAAGFESVALTAKERVGELSQAFPFGRLRRERNSMFDLVEIQLARNGRPAFRISAGVAESRGIDHVVGHVAVEDLWSSHLPRHYVLFQMPSIQRWFSLWHWPGRRVAIPGDLESLVTDVAGFAVKEVEDALVRNIIGRHVRVFEGGSNAT